MNPFLFLKFGQENHINSLHKEGLLYMNTVDFFTTCEYLEKKDANENTHSLWQPNRVVFTLNDHKLDPEDFIGPIRYRTNDIAQSNIHSHIFCMTAICTGDPIREDCQIVDSKLLELGNRLLLIYNVPEFQRRLKKVLQDEIQNGNIFKWADAKIEYIDEHNYHGEMGTFKKGNCFAFQQEWRIAISSSQYCSNPLILKLGSLEDISGVLDVQDFKNKIIRQKDGKHNLYFS